MQHTFPEIYLKVHPHHIAFLNKCGHHHVFKIVVDGNCCGFIFIVPIFSIIVLTLGLGVYSASNRNEYQKHKNNNVSGE
jgi:hypothetical protein